MKKVFPILLLLISCISILHYILLNSNKFSIAYDHKKMSEIYSKSQYVTGSASAGIGDDGLYAFAGTYYLTGGDPSQVNFENPPLGKYLIGVSILLFKNENVIYILYALTVLYITYKLGQLLGLTQNQSLLGVMFLSLDPFFLLQTKFSLLDLPLTLFFLTGIYFFIQGVQKPRKFWLSSFAFGLASATKFFPFCVILFFLLAIYVFLIKRKYLKIFLFNSLLIPVVYLASYTMYFVNHPSLIEFLHYQRWIISWRMGNPTVLGNIFLSIFTGRYRPWFPHEGLVIDHEWTWFLPFITSLSLISIFFFKIVNLKSPKSLLYIICVVFLLYLGVGSVGVSRYLLVIYPQLTLLAINTISALFVILKKPWLKLKK